MSSPPDNMKLEGLIADCFDASVVTPMVVAALEPYRESVEQIAEDYREDEASWCDYRRAVWSPVPRDVMNCVDRVVEAQAGQKIAEVPYRSEWFPVPGSTGVRARALVPPGGKVGVYLLEFEPGGKIDVHKHTQAESIFVQWGDGVIDTGKTTRLIPGEVNHIYSNTFHALVAGPAGMKAIVTAVPDWGAT